MYKYDPNLDDPWNEDPGYQFGTGGNYVPTPPPEPVVKPPDPPKDGGPNPPPPPPPPPPSPYTGSLGANLQYPTLGTAPGGNYQLPGVPVFTPPSYTAPSPFTPTTAADMANDPGYGFRRDEGARALQQSFAAQGVLNGGGSLKSILDYGQNYASNEFSNVDARRRSDYGTNYQTQYVDPYKFAYQSALDQFAPKMTEYAAQQNVGLANMNMANQNFWNDYYAQVNRQGTQFNQAYQIATT